MTTVSKETFWTQLVEDPTLYGTITTEDNIFNYRSDAVWQVMNETFIANGGVFEATKWEEMLGLTSEETSLNNRKANILNHITENLPITIGILEQLIKGLCGEGNYELNYNKDRAELTISFPAEFENEIEKLTHRLIPNVSKVEYEILLPTGYLRAEFLESTGTQYLLLDDLTVIDSDTIEWKQEFVEDGKNYSSVDAVFASTDVNSCRFYTHKDGKRAALVFFGAGASITYSQYINGRDFKASRYGLEMDGALFASSSAASGSFTGFYVFTQRAADNRLYNSRIKMMRFAVSGKCNLIPALDSTGAPCMYDTMTGEQHINSGSGQFITGFTLTQARKLDKLPASTTLTVSLPVGYDSDEGIVNALAQAGENGCVLTIQTYEVASAATTFSLRRVWVRRTENVNGLYVDADGTRWQVDWCVDIVGSSPEAEGYEQFRSVESAVEYWELTPYIDPTLEEQINSNEQE